MLTLTCKLSALPKVDYKKELSPLYKASSNRITEVTFPALAYLMIEGQGDPNTTSAYAEAVEALFSVSYTAKFALKRSAPSWDHAVTPLKGLCWTEVHSVFENNDRKNWK